MQKKELLAMKPLTATREMIRAAVTDRIKDEIESYQDMYGVKRSYVNKHYTYRCFLSAAVENGILKVAVFTRKYLIKGVKEPLYEIYISKQEKKYLTYDVMEKKWRTAKIDMLNLHEKYSYLVSAKNYQSDKTRRLVNAYFKTGKNLDVKEAVLAFQSEIKGEALKKKHRSELEQIDAVMNEVPDLPANFDKWVIKNCLEESLFYKRKPNGQAGVFCTHCGKWSDAAKKAEHGKEGMCPSCKQKGIYRSWNKQKYVTDGKSVCILQKLNDGSGYILRKFNCRIKRSHDKGWDQFEFHKYETIRSRLTEYFYEAEYFEYGEYKYTGVDRWCHFRGRNYFGYNDRCFGRGIMYTENLKRVLKDKPFAGTDLKTFFGGGEKKKIDPVFYLKTLEKYPFIEYLQKSGLNRLLKDILKGDEKGSLFDKSEKRIHEVLKLDKQRFNRLRELDGNCAVLEALQYERMTGSRLTDEHLAYVMENKIDIKDLCMDRTGLNLQKTLNFLKRQQDRNGFGFHEIRNYYEDYLDMAQERGMDITDEIVCKNARMMEFHNRYLEEKNREDKMQRDRQVNDKFHKIRENYKQNAEHFAWEEKEYTIMVPRMASDITKEGRLQHHCVGASDTYMNRMDKGESYILFLRRKQDKNIPYYTLEVTWNGEIRQFYAAYDRKPDKERVESILAKWQEEMTKRNAG